MHTHIYTHTPPGTVTTTTQLSHFIYLNPHFPGCVFTFPGEVDFICTHSCVMQYWNTKSNLETEASLAALIVGLGKYWQVMQRWKTFKMWQSVIWTAERYKSSKVEGKYLRLCYPRKQSLRQTALASWRTFLYLVLQEHSEWIVMQQSSPFGQHRCILLTNLWSVLELWPSFSSPQGIFHEDTGRDERRCQDKKDTWCWVCDICSWSCVICSC